MARRHRFADSRCRGVRDVSTRRENKAGEIEVICSGIGGELPLPLWERVGVRGSGPSIGLNPSPEAFGFDLSRKGRGEVN